MKSFFFALILLIGSSLAFDSPVVCSMDADCLTVPTNNRRISCLFPGNAKGLGNTSDPRGFCAYVQNEKVLFIYKSELVWKLSVLWCLLLFFWFMLLRGNEIKIILKILKTSQTKFF